MRIGSLFSGYGGLEMGVQLVTGGDTAWHVEFDAAPSKVLAHRWPRVPNYGDITATDFTQVDPVDVLTGGFPCQDVSHAGRRKGLIRDGEGRTRSGLWGHMLRAIDTLRPPLVVAENVRGLLSATADSDVEPCPWCMGDAGASPMRALGAVLADLADIGYDAAWCGLRAADVGAPHGRFRVFITAWPTGDTAGTGLEGPTGGRVQHGLPGAGRDEPAPLTLLPTPAVNDMGASYTPDEWDAWTDRMKAAHGNGNGHGASLHVEALRMLPTPRAGDGEKGGPNQRGSSGDLMLPSAVNLLPTPMVGSTSPAAHGQISGDYRARMDEALANWGDYAPAIARWENILGRPAPAPTEPTGKQGAHRLSPAFVEWLMGLPPGHVTAVPGLTRNHQLKALGNGVVPQQAAAAIAHLLAIRATAQEDAA